MVENWEEIRTEVASEGVSTANKDVADLTRLMESADTATINEELNGAFFDQIQWLDASTAADLKTAIEWVDWYKQEGSNLKALYDYVCSLCNTPDNHWSVIDQIGNVDLIGSFFEKNTSLCDVCRDIMGNTSWNGDNLTINDPTVIQLCNEQGFNVNEFVYKFNEQNRNRINANKEALKNFDVTSIINPEDVFWGNESYVYHKDRDPDKMYTADDVVEFPWNLSSVISQTIKSEDIEWWNFASNQDFENTINIWSVINTRWNQILEAKWEEKEEYEDKDQEKLDELEWKDKKVQKWETITPEDLLENIPRWATVELMDRKPIDTSEVWTKQVTVRVMLWEAEREITVNITIEGSTEPEVVTREATVLPEVTVIPEDEETPAEDEVIPEGSRTPEVAHKDILTLDKNDFPAENFTLPDTDVPLDNAADGQRKIANSQIESIQGKLWNTDTNIKQVLEQISSTINHLTVKNKDQLRHFLVSNNDKIPDRDLTNLELMQWVNHFLHSLDVSIDNRNDNNKENAEQEQTSKRFDDFYKLIMDSKWSDLDNFNNDKDLNRLKTFIESNPENTKVMDIYLKMQDTTITRQADNAKYQDRQAFKKVLNMLEWQYWEGKPHQDQLKQYFLDKTFEWWLKTKSLIDISKSLWIDNWQWEDLHDSDNVKRLCETRGNKFEPKHFEKTFNKKNQERIENNKNELKTFPILTILWDELPNISIKDWQLVMKRWESEDQQETNLTVDTMVTLLGLEEKAKKQRKENPWKTQFVNETEIGKTINNDIKEEWLNKIKENVSARNPGPQQKEEGGGGEIDTPTIEELKEEEITAQMRKMDKKTVFNAITKAKWNFEKESDAGKKQELADKIKEVIDALKNPGNLDEKKSQPKIAELQESMQSVCSDLVADWKFWPKTFYAMKTYLWVETTRQEDLQYKTNRGRLGGNLSSALDNFEDLAVLQDVLHDEDTNLENLQNRAAEFFEKPLDYVKYMLELSNDAFNVPWKEKIKNIIWSGSESEIKLLQLSLLPAYKWEIDWKMGPLTTKALQTYIEKKWEDWDKNNENILSLSDYNKSVIDWTDKTDANDSFVLIEWTNAQENTAYFFDKTVMNYSCDRLPGLSINTKIGNDDYTYCKTYGWESFKKNNEECVDDTDIKNKLQKIYDKEMALK